MKFKFLSFCCFMGMASAGFSQALPKGYTTALPIKGGDHNAALAALGTPGSLPSWNYSVTASAGLGGATYTGTLLGRNPNLRAKSVTDINLYVIPLKITITDTTHGAVVYDPTVPDACYTLSNSTHPSDVSLVTQSPMFQTNLYDGGVGHAPTMDGVDVTQGVPSQYIDAYLRANWWTLVGGTNFHLNFIVTVLPTQNMSFTVSGQANYVGGVDYGGCGRIGVIDINNFDPAIISLLQANPSVNPGIFPMLLTNSVVLGEGSSQLFANTCCILGYHSGYISGPNLQVYSPFSVSAPFGDICTISHEVAEAVMDPTTNNATPNWGNEGQVVGACQNNLEVGDPLSPGFGTATAPFTITQNGFTYTLQELVFFDWFFGTPSHGAGGKYSDNGTFGGSAILCPPGGTH